MSRDASVAMQAALAADNKYQPILLVELDFDTTVGTIAGTPEEPDATIEWKVRPAGNYGAADVYLSLDDGHTWTNCYDWAVEQGYGIVRADGVTRVPLPHFYGGETKPTDTLRVKVEFHQNQGAVEIEYIEIEVNYAEGSISDSVTWKPDTDTEWDEGTHISTQALNDRLRPIYNSCIYIPPERANGIDQDHGFMRVVPSSYGFANPLWVCRGVEETLTDRDGKTFTVQKQPVSAASAAFTVEGWFWRETWVGRGETELTDTDLYSNKGGPLFGWMSRGSVPGEPATQRYHGVLLLQSGDALYAIMAYPTINGQKRMQMMNGISRVHNGTDTLWPYTHVYNLDGELSSWNDGWNHVALTYNGKGGVTIFVNGDSQFTKNIWQQFDWETGSSSFDEHPPYVPDTRGDFFVGGGARSNSAAHRWVGYADQVRVWNVCRSQGQILQHAKTLPNADMISAWEDAGMVGFWRFNEYGLQSVDDAATGDNDGELIIAEDAPGSNSVQWKFRVSWENWDPDNPVRQATWLSEAINVTSPASNVYYTNAPHDIVWDGNTYEGAGDFAGIEESAEETSMLEARGITLTLSGVVASHVSIALQAHYVERPMQVHLGLLGPDGALVVDPVELFTGKMDTMPVEIGETATVSMSCENRLADWEQPSTRRWTAREQKQRYPGDEGFQYTAAMVDKVIWWPSHFDGDTDGT